MFFWNSLAFFNDPTDVGNLPQQDGRHFFLSVQIFYLMITGINRDFILFDALVNMITSSTYKLK